MHPVPKHTQAVPTTTAVINILLFRAVCCSPILLCPRTVKSVVGGCSSRLRAGGEISSRAKVQHLQANAVELMTLVGEQGIYWLMRAGDVDDVERKHRQISSKCSRANPPTQEDLNQIQATVKRPGELITVMYCISPAHL